MINVGGDDQLVLHNYECPLFDLGISIFCRILPCSLDQHLYLYLSSCPVGHETEISYFGRADYEQYKLDPTLRW